jgi:hypothetical protein
MHEAFCRVSFKSESNEVYCSVEDGSTLITFSNITIYFSSRRSAPLNCFPRAYSSLYIRESGAEKPWEINTTGRPMCRGGEDRER